MDFSSSATPAVVEYTLTLTDTSTLVGAPDTPTISGDGAGYAFSLVATTCDTVLPVGVTSQATIRAIFTDKIAAAGTLSSGAASQPRTRRHRT